LIIERQEGGFREAALNDLASLDSQYSVLIQRCFGDASGKNTSTFSGFLPGSVDRPEQTPQSGSEHETGRVD
jgi:hypothetical protein